MAEKGAIGSTKEVNKVLIASLAGFGQTPAARLFHLHEDYIDSCKQLAIESP